MRAFEPKQKSDHKTKPVRHPKPGQEVSERSHAVSPSIYLQWATGNQAINQMLWTPDSVEGDSDPKATAHFAHDASRNSMDGSRTERVQTKLTVNAQGDIYEQEANRVADQVMRMPEPQLQGSCPCGGSCPECQASGSEGNIEHLQRQRIQPGDTGWTEAPSVVHDVLNSSGRPLDTDVKDFMELRFGKDFSQVRVHVDGQAADSARAVDALAYTVGQDIVFGPGHYLPQSGEGRRLLAHELAHVAQQSSSQQTGQARSGSAPRSVLMREPAPDNPTQSQDGGGTQMGSAPAAAAPEWVTEDLKRKFAAVVLAESVPEQEYDVMWVYLNLVTAAKGEAGLTKSSAFNGKGIRYRQYLYVLGDETYASDKLPAEPEFKGYDTIADYCTNNRWFKNHRVERAKLLKFTVDEIFTVPESSAYPGWTGQGSLKDFNNVSNDDLYWKRARAYYWLQVNGSVKDTYVKALLPQQPDGLITVIFNADAIKAYFDANPDKLSEVVPLYKPDRGK
jgi:Domain of unknown function (DUF4157)